MGAATGYFYDEDGFEGGDRLYIAFFSFGGLGSLRLHVLLRFQSLVFLESI